MDNKNSIQYFSYKNNIEPFFAGDSINWQIDFTNFKSIDGYLLNLVFVNTKDKFTVNSNGNTDGSFSVAIAGTVTSNYKNGKYLLFIVLTRLSDNFTKQIEYGYLEIKENILHVAELDNRTHAEKMIELINLILEGKIEDDVSSYSINGRQLNKYSFKELIELRNQYKLEVEAEKIKKDIKEKGFSNRNKLKILFTPPWKFK